LLEPAQWTPSFLPVHIVDRPRAQVPSNFVAMPRQAVRTSATASSGKSTTLD